MKDNRAIFVNVQGDRRIERVEFGVMFRFDLPTANFDLWAATSKIRGVVEHTREKLIDCFEKQTTEKVFWSIGRPHPATVEHGVNGNWAEVRQLIDFTLAISRSFMGNDCAIVEMSTVLVKTYSMLFDSVEDLNKNIFEDLKPIVNRTEGEMPNIGCSLQMRFFRYGDGQRYYAGRTLANFGIDKR